MARTHPPLSEEEIATLNDEDLDDRVWLRLLDRLDPAEPEQLLGVPAGVRAFLATRLFEWEVMNGGLHQFFFNYPNPELLAVLLDGYSYLGLEDARQTVEDVIAPIANAEDQWRPSLRDGTIETFFGSYAESALPAYDDQIRLHDIERIRFVRANPALFTG